jgi:hypothetical protein
MAARRQLRAVGVYAVLWLLGAVPLALGLDSTWTAGGLGLAFPGGGFLYGGAPVLAAVSALAVFLAVFLWWATGPILLPPIVWIGSAIAAALTTTAGETASGIVALAVGPALIVGAHLIHRARHARQRQAGAKLNEQLRQRTFTVTGPPGLDTRVPVAEHTESDLAHLRHSLDLALQPLDSFEGFIKIDQFREAATRYQLNALSYGLSMSQFTRTPAFSGYLAEAQRNAIEKMLDRRVWSYWATENAWGKLNLNPDPIDTDENIMLTGFYGVMVGMYEALNDDRYSADGALTFRWNDRRAFTHDFGTLASITHRNFAGSPWSVFACEPNWIYTVCNTFGLNTLLSHDQLHGTSYFPDVEPAIRRAYETEFLRPDGRIIGVRSAHLGLSWNFWSGSAVQLTTSYWMHASLPDLAQRNWWLLRESLDLKDGELRIPGSVANRVDPGSYQLGADTYARIVTLMAAREVGDEEWATAAQRSLDNVEVDAANGARRYAGSSPMANFYAGLGRFGRQSALRDLIAYGPPSTWRAGPILSEAAYPDVLVARAVTDGTALDLVLRPGDGPKRTTLRIERLEPNREYAVSGSLASTVVASPTGTADVDVDLGGRLEVRLAPR